MIVSQCFPGTRVFMSSDHVCCIKIWRSSTSKPEIKMEPQSVWPVWFGGHIKWLECHLSHFQWKKKHGVSIKLIDREVKVLGYTTS